MNTGERGISTTIMSVSGNEDNEIMDTLSNATDEGTKNELTVSIVLSLTSTSPTQFAEINILSPITDDRLFDSIDISTQLHSFKQDIPITVEEHNGNRGEAYTRLAASQQILALLQDDDVLNPVNRILLSVRNTVERLPCRIIENGPKETELIT